MITMNNVLFGEFIEVGNELIIDCGCKNTGIFSSVMGRTFFEYLDIWNTAFTLIGGEKNVMISHFHKDHVNGLDHLAAHQFNRVYVPSITLDNGGIHIFKKSLLCYVVGSYNIKKIAQVYLNQVYLANELAINITGIMPICRGDIINIGENIHEIKWPPIKGQIGISVTVLNEVINALRQENYIPKIMDMIDQISELYNRYIEMVNAHGDFIIESGIELINNITISLEKFYTAVDNIHLDEIKRIKERIDHISQLNRQIRGDINRTSIVSLMRYNVMDEEKVALFTGDITSDLYNKYIGNDIDKVNILKVPHHGTNERHHYSDMLPDAEILLISNGIYRIWNITDRYNRYLINGEIICTNGSQTCKINNNNNGCPLNCSCKNGDILV
ncbi:hypothetical protein KTC96_06515 [Clostridium estertheticum]|uniref:hypothetical protein n=1 Tax=Clostridium estertheticum TaxID=238834 RepID=UPI001C7CE369|nr:hypothetical protein [Clostridium estertheticum]MBX4261312.1 hypothetical protein [Clostridium estertheticum]WLC71651.1 hypothetical protein KTC96_06515 [Clostridium estertheticum]